jgi:membrane fusion protein, multidrug efflux system
MKRLRPAAAALAVLLLGACQKQASQAPRPIRPVLSMVVSQSAASGLALAGTVQPRVQTAFAFRVLGRLIARPVNTGDIVEKGQVLAAIDPIALRLASQAAAAELSSSEALLANAIGVEERQSQLLKSSATTQALYEAAQQARAAAQANVARAQSALAKAREQLDYAILKSDFAGVVTSVGAEVGQTVSPGEAVVNVAEPGSRDAVIDIPDAYSSALAPGGRFKVSLQLNPAIEASGAIREIAPEADAATRTRRVKIALDNPPPTFRLGSTITASLAANAKSAVRLPASAVLKKDGRDWVWIVDPKSATVSTREIAISREGDDFVDVRSGLEPAMRVVTAGVHSLVEGQPVKIDPEAAP